MRSSSRREFLKHVGLAAPAAGLTGCTAPSSRSATGNGALSVIGRVTGPDGGIEGVSVTDGLTVTPTDANGRFHLQAAAHRPFVYLSVPAGYRLPTHTHTGTARFYRPLDAADGEPIEVEFSLHPLPHSDDTHAFVFLADPQVRTEAEAAQLQDETVPDVRTTSAALAPQPVFGVGGGDLVFDALSLFSEYEDAVQQMDLPFVQVVGNHDLNVNAATDPDATAPFRKQFGPTYYSFDRGAVHYVVLDDVYWPGNDGFGGETDSYLGHLPAPQLRWLEQDLSLIEDGRPVVVFAHIPPLSTGYDRRDEARPSVRNQIVNRTALYDLLAPFDAHIVTGHLHENEHRGAAGPHEHVVGTVCGAWWTGPICYDGTPRGYAVYEIAGETLRWRYKSTGQGADHQMRLTRTAPDRMVANVWDADDEWTITWYENGIQTGKMTPIRGLDPLAERLYGGADQPDKYDWVAPHPTDHLFEASYDPTANRVHVEATDRFGRTYRTPLSASSDRSPGSDDASP